MSNSSKSVFVFLIITASISFVSSCKKETVLPKISSYNYFPTTNGKWVRYQVDSVYHSENDNNNDDSVYTFQFEVMEKLDSSFLDGEGKENQIIKYYRRTDSLSSWNFVNVWTQSLTPTAAYRSENNIRMHKLAFPINSSITWNGNDANTFDEEMYHYENINESGSYNSLFFDSTISVLQIDENNYVEKIYGKEVYATHVGLIYKERNELGKRNGIVVKGFEVRMKVISFGF